MGGAAAAVVALAGATFVLVGTDGVRPITVSSTSATRWLVNRAAGQSVAVLADGSTGRVLARINAPDAAVDEQAVQGSGGAFLVAKANGTVRSISTSQIQLGNPTTVSTLALAGAKFAVGQSGLTVLDPASGQASVVPADSAVRSLTTTTAPQSAIGGDGSIWLVDGTSVSHVAVDGIRHVTTLATPVGQLAVLGSTGVALDPNGTRLSWLDGPSVTIKDLPNAAKAVLQQAGPESTCAWLGSGDDLLCVGRHGVVARHHVVGLNLRVGERLAVAGSFAAVVRPGATTIDRIDLERDQLDTGRIASVPTGADLAVVATHDQIWVDDLSGTTAWVFNRFGFTVVDKADQRSPLYDAAGQTLGGGSGDGGQNPVGRPTSGPTNPQNTDPNPGIDDPPVAVDDNVTARADSTVTVPVTSNDHDPEGQPIAVSAVGLAGHGTTDIVDANTVSYQPDTGFVGTDRFTYTIVDPQGQPATATVTVELIDRSAANRIPLTSPDEATTRPGTPVIIDVLANDVDPERDPLSISSFGTAASGTLAVKPGPAGTKALEYTPQPGIENVTDTFTYRAADPQNGISEATRVTVKIRPLSIANEAPITKPDAVRVRRNVASLVAVMANDVDPDSDRLTLTVPGPPTPGLRVEVVGDNLRITAEAGLAPLTTIDYQVDDGHGHTPLGRLMVAVIDDQQPNRPPVANPDTASVVTGASVRIDVLANDRDPDNDPLSLVGVSQPASGRGTARVEGSSIRFTPRDAPNGQPVMFEYRISDGHGHEVTGSVTVAVLAEALPAPPLARDDSASTTEGKAVSIDVLANDSDPSGSEPQISGVPQCPAGGTARVVDGRVTYTPPTGRSGVFRCRYEVSNRQGLTASAFIIITVDPATRANRPPVVTDLPVTVEAGSSTTINLLTNASDPDGDPLTVVPGSPSVSSGQFVGGAYLAPNVAGVVTLTFQVSDGKATTQGRVSITVKEKAKVTPQPLARDDTATSPDGGPVAVNVLDNDTNQGGNQSDLVVDNVGPASSGGTASQSQNRVIISPPTDPKFSGVVSARYTIRNAENQTASATVTVTFPAKVNHPPIAVGDALFMSSGDTQTVAVNLNDSDPDGDPLTYTLIGSPPPSAGTASMSPNGLLRFTAAQHPDQRIVVLRYTVSDGQLSDSANVTITVSPCASGLPIVVANAMKFTPYRTPININLDTLVTNGNVLPSSVNGAGLTGPTGTYVPPAGQNGSVVISFVAHNACGDTAGTLTIDVNHAPQPATVRRGLAPGATLTIPITELGSDDEPLTIAATTGNPAWVTRTPTELLVAPPLSVDGTFTFQVTIVDPGGLTAQATVTITITNRPPVALPDAVVLTAPRTTFDPTRNDTDPEGGPLTLQAYPTQVTFSDGTIGTITREAGNTLAIVHTGGAATATFTYTIVDDHGLTASAVVTLISLELPPPTTTTTTPTPTTTTTTTPITTTPITTIPITTIPITITTITLPATTIEIGIGGGIGPPP